MNRVRLFCLPLLIFLSCSCTASNRPMAPPTAIEIHKQWSGNFPILALNRLPDGQQHNRSGFIANGIIFASVWQAFMPGEELPAVDFSQDLVLFIRNVDFYNRINIAKIILDGETVEIVAMETLSARPIEENVALALAVVPRKGIRVLKVDGQLAVPVN